MAHGMSLSGPWLQLAGSLLAVLALSAYVHWLWGGRTRLSLDRTAALAAFAAEHPGVAASDALITADGRAALLRLAGDDRLGLLAAFGARWRTRIVSPTDVATVDTADGGVRLVLREIAQPAVALRFADDADAEPWLRALRGDGR